jgi:hypothetical protein
MARISRSIPIQVPLPDAPGVRASSLEELIAAFHRARAAIADLFAHIGIDPTKARESARELGLNRGLTWRLTRIVRESDPRSVVSDVPGASSMTKFFEACLQRGAPQQAIDSAIAALDAFEASVSACSGDRKTLAMLMANTSAGRTAGESEKVRRKLFEGACGVWGGQAQARFVTVFVFPSPDDPTKLDAAHITGLVGFRRLSTRAWPLSYEAVHRASGAAAPFIKEPLDPAGPTEGQAQLLKGYCSPALPDIQVVISGDYKRFELASGPVGNEGLTTCVFGTRLRRMYERYSTTPDTAGFMVLLQTPVEQVQFDMFVHKSLGVEEPPRTQLLDRLLFPHSNVESDFERQSLPIGETPALLPRGLAGTLCPYIPWYSRLVADITTKLNMPLDDFVGSRFEMAFPPISTTLSRRFDLKPPPA